MTGKPAARITDTVVKGKIVTGSRTVLIGSQGGIACSVCKDGIKTGSPVNPQLGAKVLSGSADLDFSLPGAMPLVWQRQYSSYVNQREGGHCGALGYGWSMPLELRLTLNEEACLLHDTQGRTITFDALLPGQSLYSPSEDVWLLRSGEDAQSNGLHQESAALWFAREQSLQTIPQGEGQTASSPGWYSASYSRFAYLPADLVRSRDVIFAANGTGDVAWVFVPANWRALQSDPETLASPQWVLLGKIDRFGRMQRYRFEEVLGEQRLVSVEDGLGRCYALHYAAVTKARQAQHYASGYFWQADSGVRLTHVELTRDPHSAAAAAALTLVRYEYSGEGDLTEVHSRHGDIVRRFAYKNHLMVFHQEQDGPEHHYQYERFEPGAKAIEQRNQQGLDYRFEYEDLPPQEGEPRRRAIVTDSLKRTETYVFKGEAGLERLVEHIRADGSIIRRQYNPYGHLTGITDPLGRKTYMVVDGMGKVQRMQNPDGSSSSQEWDSATGLLNSSTDALGRRTEFAYDACRRMVRITRSDGSSEHYSYPELARDSLNADKPSAITDVNGGIKHLTYTAAGQLQSYTDCSGKTTRYRYNRWGQTLAVTNALQQSMRYEYDERDQLVSVHYADGSSEHYSHDARGQLTQVSAQGAHGSQSSQSAANVRMRHDLWGRLIEREYAGHSLRFIYDEAGRLITLTNENAEHTHFAWDAMDRLTQETGFDKRVQSYQYDAAGQLEQSADGWASEQTLPEHITRYEWNVLGQLQARHLPANADTGAQSTHYTWNQVGELAKASVWQLTGEGEPQLLSEALIERDALGRVTGETQRLYKTDAPGMLEFEHRIAHTLDALGNRTGSELPGLGDVGYLHYGSGHVHGITWQGESVVDIERDALHREIKRQVHCAGLSRELHWDAAGRWGRMQLEGASQTALSLPVIAGALSHKHYHYDSLGQMVGVQTSQGLNRYAYDAQGRLTAAHTPDAGLQRWQFDPAGNRLPILASVSTDGQNQITGHLNDIDRLRAEQRGIQEQQHVSKEQLGEFSFNPLQGAGSARSNASDALDHISHWPGNRMEYYANAQDPSSHGTSLRYTYDSRGNRISSYDTRSEQTQRLGYDAGNQLIGIDFIDNEGIRQSQYYRYDAFGRRLAKYMREAGETSGVNYYGWDGDRLVHTERYTRNDSLAQITHTIYEPSSFTPLLQLARTGKTAPTPVENMLSQATPEIRQALRDQLSDIGILHERMKSQWQAMGMDPHLMSEQLAQIRRLQQAQQQALQDRVEGVQLRYYHCDHLGTPHALVNSEGEVDWAARLDSWGNINEEYNPQNLYQPIRLPGQHEDEITGLFYNRFRYYDSRIGQYANQDPIGLNGSLNISSYPLNPVQWVDPMGLQTVSPSTMSCEAAMKAKPVSLSDDAIAIATRQKQCSSGAGTGGESANSESLLTKVFNWFKSPDNVKTVGDAATSVVTNTGGFAAKASVNPVGAAGGSAIAVANASLDPQVGNGVLNIRARLAIDKCVKLGACTAEEDVPKLRQLASEGKVTEFNKILKEKYDNWMPEK